MLSVDDAINDRCPWSGDAIQADSLTTYKGHVVGFCNPGCKDKFATAIAHFEQAIG
ncbi:glutathione S-transferase [Alphaproteobacteria bacterium]|nr:glutathione S-transferase [Alphaproteobacteria bacterium]